MINQDILDEARGIIQETDPNNTHVTDSTFINWINACTLQLFSIIGTYPKASTAGITVATSITLPETTLKIDYASFATADGVKHPLKTIDFPNFVLMNYDWENTPVGMPQYLVRMDTNVWMMYPNPAPEYLGLPMNIMGTSIPTPTTLPTQEPPISIVLHPCYPHYLAWKAFLVLNNPDRAKEEYAIYDGLRKLNTNTATSTTGSMQSLRMTL